MADDRKVIAVFGATGQQGGGVVRALQADGRFKVRALTRHPDKHPGLGDEVVEADLDRPETLKAAFAGAYGVFLVTNFWEPGTDELKQATAAVRAAREAGIKHFIWSTLPSTPRRPPRATWPPGYSAGKPLAVASAETLTFTVGMVWMAASAGTGLDGAWVWACAADAASRKTARLMADCLKWRVDMVAVVAVFCKRE